MSIIVFSAGEAGNDSEAEAHSALDGGEDADDATTEFGGPTRTEEGPGGGTTTDGTGKGGTGDEAEGPAAAVASALTAAATVVGDSEEAENGPSTQAPVRPPVC